MLEKYTFQIWAQSDIYTGSLQQWLHTPVATRKLMLNDLSIWTLTLTSTLWITRPVKGQFANSQLCEW